MVKVDGVKIALENATDNEQAKQLLIQAIEQEADIGDWLLKALKDDKLQLNIVGKGRPAEINVEACQFAIGANEDQMKQEAFVADMENRFNIKRTKALEYWSWAKRIIDRGFY